MKAEGSTTPIVVLQKFKVKEETKEWCLNKQRLSPSSSPIPSTSVAIAPNNNLSTVTSLTVSNTSPSTQITNNNKESQPVDFQNKVSAVSINQTIIINQSKEKSTREETTQDKKESQSSPPPVPTTTSLFKSKLQPQQLQVNGQPSSSDIESSSAPHCVKPEGDDATIVTSKQQKIDDGAVDETTTITTITTTTTTTTTNSNNGTTAGLKCISTIFSGHSKLKRLLGTLVQFANNISTETGDTVRTLIFSLLSGNLTAEEFHTALQEATNFPLRDFVLPYLIHTLPSLRRNLTNAARANNQTNVQYLRYNESAILETVSLTVPSGETVELFGDHSNNGTNSQGNNSSNYDIRFSNVQHTNSSSVGSLHHFTTSATKRRASDTPYYENGSGEDAPIYGKRSLNTWSHHHQQQQQQQYQQSDSYCWYHPLRGAIQNHSHSGQNLAPPNLVQINQLPSINYQQPQSQPQPQPQSQSQSQSQQQQQQQQQQQVNSNCSLDDEWKNIHVMLNCILSMVEKTKRALVILQRRGCPSPAAVAVSTAPVVPSHTTSIAPNQNFNTNINNNISTNGLPSDRDSNFKRLSGELMAQTIRATEDRVAAEVKRRAEEAVQQVKRAALAEVQRAVAAAVAESRETLRIHQLLDISLPHRSQGLLRQNQLAQLNNHINSTGEITLKNNSTSGSNLIEEDEKDGLDLTNVGNSCWNCGRNALETCGGCGTARYCGSFCQHRDWESGGHHATCNISSTRESRRSNSPSSPRNITNVNINNSNSSNSVKGK